MNQNMRACMRRTLTIGVTCLALSRAVAQNYDISWHTVDGGGATFSTGGAYSLGGTIGQPDAGSFSQPMAGGGFSLIGGFWAVSVPICTCPGDMNGDSLKNGKDVQAFTTCAIAGGTCGCADMDGIGGITATDINLFVNDLLTGGTCP